jgi:hypothetical protein
MKTISVVFLLVLFTAYTGLSYAGDKPYMNDVKLSLAKKSGLFNLSLDLQLGLNFSTTNFELSQTDTSNTINNTSSKTGPGIAAVLAVDFLGYGFCTGLQYTSKGFQTVSNTNTSLNYFVIPLLFYFDFKIDKVIIDGNAGPYFGLLLSQDESALYKAKNFDLGLTGSLQGTYLFQKHLGALLGVKYEYGGLNNLGNNELVKSIRTSTFYVYTGVKFIL